MVSDGLYLFRVTAECTAGLIAQGLFDQLFRIEKSTSPSNNSSGPNDLLSILIITLLPIILRSEKARRKKR